ncbi:MAG TPA: enoyl-CoA hydratase/isomerase family protein [Solirubrobacterales bacterium]|nr:enoyl-CoA hydratase/isomerase family protein [Solirubrobacterales bacterium]
MTDSSQSFEKIQYAVADHVATITLDDPETRNALSDQLLSELIAALKLARGDDEVRVVVLASSHEKVFSAGGNLAAFGGDSGTVEKFDGASLFTDAFKLLGELGKPSIVAAEGHVLAGSLGLALACDLILASDTATFGTPEITVGLFPFMIMALIYRNVGRKKTNEMLLLGERLTAEEAERAGIVNKVVRPELFEDNLRGWTDLLAAKSPLIMRMGKDAMWRQMDMPLVEALDYLRSQLAIELSTEDAVEGVKAFFEKREPEWKGR